MGDQLNITSAEQFKKLVLQADKPVLVDFWSPQCQPCQMIADLVQQIASERKGKMDVYKVNVLDFPRLAAENDVRSLPNLVIFHKGKIQDRKVGAQPKQNFDNWIDETLRKIEKAPDQATPIDTLSSIAAGTVAIGQQEGSRLA